MFRPVKGCPQGVKYKGMKVQQILSKMCVCVCVCVCGVKMQYCELKLNQ